MARHVAACPRCQARALAGEGVAAPGRRPKATPRDAPRMWRAAVFILLALVLALGALVLLTLARR